VKFLTILDRLFHRTVPLEAQLQALAEYGIRTNDGVAVDDLLYRFRREQYEKQPYKLLLCALGSESERDLTRFLSDNIWHLDTECIEGPSSYVRIATRMATLAAGALPITNVRDDVDLDQGKARVSFALNEHEYNWDAEVRDDWIDPAILTNFVRLLDGQKSSKRFTYLDLKGQDCIIGCSNEGQLAMLRKGTGLDLEWLR
jgi:hypothetical protein